MEQQSISVAKAGITATLKSRCALLGAANPKYGRFDDFAPIGEQINMPASLLSRFDLIFIMGDKPDPKKDGAIAEHILKAHSIGETIVSHRKNPIPGVNEEYIAEQLKPVTPDIEPVLFRKPKISGDGGAYAGGARDSLWSSTTESRAKAGSITRSGAEGAFPRTASGRSRLPATVERA
jgi:hypothetical protein